MKLVATALRQSGVQVPLIGVTPYGAVANRHLLDEVQGGSLAMPYEAPTPDEAPLNSYHSHFILVDSQNQRRDAWGDEINMRVAFEAFYLERKSVPMVLLVVQGGPGTISTVRATAEQGSPIVVVAGSGGAATAIKYYCDQCDKLKAERAAGGVAGAFADDEWPQAMWPKAAAPRTLVKLGSCPCWASLCCIASSPSRSRVQRCEESVSMSWRTSSSERSKTKSMVMLP